MPTAAAIMGRMNVEPLRVKFPAFVVIPNEVRDLKIPRHARNDKEYPAPWGGAVY